MKKLLLMALCGTVLFGACNKDDDDDNGTPKARVMFVNGALDADSLRGRINNTVFSTIAFLGNSGYMNADAASSATVDFTFTGSGSVFQSATQNLVANNSYSIFAGGGANSKILIVENDDLSAPASGKAKVRFVNLSPDNINGKAFISLSSVDSNITSGMAGNFHEVTAGIQDVAFGDFPKSDDIDDFNLVSGKIYTFIFTGTESGTGNAGFNLTAITNN